MRPLLRDPLYLTLGVSCALHLAFMGYVLALPPSAELSPAMANERIVKFIIARFPRPIRAEQEAPAPPPRFVPPPVREQLAARTPARERLAKRPPHKLPPHRAERPIPPAPKVVQAAAPAVITSKPSVDDTAEIKVAAVAVATGTGPEGPASPVVVQADAPSDASASVASSEFEPGPDLEGLRRGYIGRLNRYFRRMRTYPRRARRAGLEGTVLLEIVLDDQGRIIDIRVAQSSGHRILDDAARSAVAALGAVPSPPGELQWRSQAVQVPFVYSLSG